MNSSEANDQSDQISVLEIAAEGMIDQHISTALSDARDMKITAHHTTARDAIKLFRQRHFDVVILDIGMADEDGLMIINRIKEIDRDVKIIMVATLSFANVRKSMAGFERGAAEFIQPPPSFLSNNDSTQFSKDLRRAIRGLGDARRKEPLRQISTSPIAAKQPSLNLKLVPPATDRPEILAIGSSTGGPAALLRNTIRADKLEKIAEGK